MPVPESARIIGRQAENLHLDPARLGGGGKGARAGVGVETHKVELDRIRCAILGRQGRGHIQPRRGVEPRRDIVVIGQPIAHPAGKLGQLRADDRSRKVLQPHIVKRQLVLPARKGHGQFRVVLPVGALMLFPIMLIGARHDHAARRQIGVIGDQDATLACVDHLVGLERETADLADGADLAPMPQRAKRMGRILDHGNAARIAQRHDRVHIRGVAAHMADDDGLDRVVELGFEIAHVDAIILAYLDQHGLQARMHHRRRHGGKCESGDQHPRAGRQRQRFERQKDRRRA